MEKGSTTFRITILSKKYYMLKVAERIKEMEIDERIILGVLCALVMSINTLWVFFDT